MSAAHYQVHEDSFSVDQIFLSEDRDISYNISCETSMAACETNPFLLCDVLPSAVTPAGRRALHAFEDAFDGEPTLQRHPLRQLKGEVTSDGFAVDINIDPMAKATVNGYLLWFGR